MAGDFADDLRRMRESRVPSAARSEAVNITVTLAIVAGVFGGCALAAWLAFFEERAAHRRTIALLQRSHEREARLAARAQATNDVAEALLSARRTVHRHHGAN
jgi:hypothetical protein